MQHRYWRLDLSWTAADHLSGVSYAQSYRSCDLMSGVVTYMVMLDPAAISIQD